MAVSYFDLHCDTAGAAFLKGENLYKNSLCVDFERMSGFNSPCAFFAVWATYGEHKNPFNYACSVIDFIKKQVAGYNGAVGVFPFTADENKPEYGYPKIYISIEGGDALEGNLENICKFKELGVSMLTLTWNYKNELGNGAHSGDTSGLTGFGKEAVKQLENSGIIVDVSHLNDEGFKGICNIANRPFIASHSNSFAICPHARNLKDWQIKEIAGRGGLIGINLFQQFVSTKEKSSLNDLLLHIGHIADIAGTIGCISIGTDFDGMAEPVEGVETISGMSILFALLERAFGTECAEKILWRNAVNFLEAYQNR